MNYKEKYYKYKVKYYDLLKREQIELSNIGGSSQNQLIERYKTKYSPEEKQDHSLPKQLIEPVINFPSELQISEQKVKKIYNDHIINYDINNYYEIFYNLKKPDLSEPYVLNLLEKGLEYKLQEPITDDEIKLIKKIFNVPENIFLTVEESLYDDYNLYVFELITQPVVLNIILPRNEKIYVNIYEIDRSWKESPGIIENFYKK